MDEIVLAVDSAGDRATIAVCDGLADRSHLVESSLPERVFGWLHHECTADWILRLDDDEVPSRALLGALPELITERRLTHVRLARRWLYPDSAHYLSSLPWAPDYQTRLVRNVPGIWSFPGSLHTNIEVLGEGRLSELPLYHANPLLQSPDVRREKSLRYSRLAHGQDRGLAGDCIYLPEEAPGAELAKVGAEDRPAIEALLSGAGSGAANGPGPPGNGAARPGLITRRTLDRFHSQRLVLPRGYRAHVAFVDAPRMLPAGAVRHQRVVVENLGEEWWSWGTNGGPAIRVGHRWLDSTGAPTGLEGRPAPFTETVLPGRATTVELRAVAPGEPGAYTLEVDLVHEGVRWFGRPARAAIDVGAQRRIGITGELGPYRHVGDDAVMAAHLARLAAEAPEWQPVIFNQHPETMTARFGHQAAESLHAALLGDLSPAAGRAQQLARLVPRTASLVRAARRRRRGLRPRRSDARYARFLSDLARLDLLVLAGAGSVTSTFSARALWPQMATLLAARATGVPTLVSGITAGPFTGAADRAIAAAGLRSASAITVRDATVSKARLRRLGVPANRIREGIDDAVALEPAPAGEVDQAVAALGIGEAAGFVAVSLHAWPGMEGALDPLTGLLEHLALNHDLATVFVPNVVAEPHDDRRLGRALATRLPRTARFRLLDPLPLDDVLLGLVGRAALAVGSRYHLSVFAAARGVPALGLHSDGYTSDKLAGLSALAPDRVRALPAGASTAELTAASEALLAAGRAEPLAAPLLAETRLLRELSGRDVAAS